MSRLKGHAKDVLKLSLRKLFEFGQLFGVDFLPRHFHSEVPSIRELKKSAHWKQPYSMMGVSGTAVHDQLDFVKECCDGRVIEEITSLNLHADASRRNGAAGFGPVEADFLFAFIYTKKPSQIFQIGCGVSTAICLLAAEKANYKPDVRCVEPYPTKYLIEQEREGNITLIKKKAQSLDMRSIEELESDVLFFVDSTHTLGPAGECGRIILEMLPRLKQGAFVHFHDIYFPYDYGRHILDTALFFWHESVLLHAFLSCNSKFRIRASLSMLHYANRDALCELLPNYRPAANDEGLNVGRGHFPSSTYLQVVN